MLLDKEMAVPTIKIRTIIIVILLLLSVYLFFINSIKSRSLIENKLKLEQVEKDYKLATKIIDSIKINIALVDKRIQAQDTLIEKSIKQTKHWRASYFNLKKQAEYESKNPIHTTYDSQLKYLLSKYPPPRHFVQD